MNTNILKKFAQQARRKLLEQIGAKLELVLTTDSAELREKSAQINKLREAINRTSKEQVIDKVAYTWFNRLMALRFMDANDYHPAGISIVTPREGYTTPEILEEAKQGMIPDDLHVNRQHIFDVLDGKIPASNAQNEAYKELLTGACNHLHTIFPFLFERIDDYTELLLPDDLTSEFSIVHDVRIGMTNEDCKEVEIIGWLYQFYISEKKDEVFASKSSTVKKEDIPAATQLFTPRWIVEYMVQNTVGKLWLQNHPNSGLRDHMQYYIESASVAPSGEMAEGQSGDFLKVNSVEELTLLDQACGSGHILVYGFELLSKIYEEEGYNPSEIPQLIIEKNLYGFEIDDRAAQLAGLALMMKARSYQRRFFRKEIKPNIFCFRDYPYSIEDTEETFKALGIPVSDELLHDIGNMQQATNFGSLIIPRTDSNTLTRSLASLKQKSTIQDVFLTPKLEALQITVSQLVLLGKKYHCVVDNPPYMGGGNMNKELADFVKREYPKAKADLMTCFMETGLKVLEPKGFLGMINQHSWMFLSSYENLREELIGNTFVDTLLHLGPRTFPEIGGEVVQNASFTLWNNKVVDNGVFVRLVDYGNSKLKQTKTLEAINNPDCGWYYTANQKDFEKIPGSPIGYWLSMQFIKMVNSEFKIGNRCFCSEGIKTSDNLRFLRLIHEVGKDSIQNLWSLHYKGGSFRKWAGNLEHCVYWEDDGYELRNLKSAGIQGERAFSKLGLTWSDVTSGRISFRIKKKGCKFDSAAPSGYFIDGSLLTNIAFLNSNIVNLLAKIYNPTLHFKVGNFRNLPLPVHKSTIERLSQECINISMVEWNSRETSWDFIHNELIRIKAHDLEESLDLYQQYWTNKFNQLHHNEEDLNAQFIEIYGLQEELTPDVPLKDITILKEELDQKVLKKISESYKSGWELKDDKWHLTPNTQNLTPKPTLPFNAKEIFSQFISYAVGCMFGRYALDKEGLILANQGETLEDYLDKVGVRDEVLGVRDEVLGVRGEVLGSNLKPNTQNLTPSFLPDDDNIIPVLDGDWFEDDITGRFTEFLKVSFGKESLEKNLAFVKECIGMDIRKYFIKEFYKDHIKRYKKRPIYWMFSSPKGSFNVLIYMHRYTPDTLSRVLNGYLNAYREKLNTHIEQLDRLIETGTGAEQTKASKQKDKMRVVLLELQEYERDILYPIASERIAIDLDDGVLVNYNKFGKAIKPVPGLNDKKTKDKVRGFDWIDGEEIRD